VRAAVQVGGLQRVDERQKACDRLVHLQRHLMPDLAHLVKGPRQGDVLHQGDTVFLSLLPDLRSDGTGALRNWWTPEDSATFKTLGDRLAAQYDKICPLDGGKACLNGRLTLGENIGDLGGLSMAYKAYRLSLKGKEAPVIDGLTGDQRFFISYAQHYRNLYRDPFLRQLMETDPHSPSFARVNAVLRNFDPFYAAFKVKPGDRMYLPPAERVRIW